MEKAKQILLSQGCTCVLCRDQLCTTSHRRGVAPLMELLDSGEDFRGYCAADKVVGKATAMLYRLLGVKALWAGVISESAVEALAQSGIAVSWEQKVPYIVNRAGTGSCPMEAATKHTDDPHEALAAIRQALHALQG